MKGQWIGSCTGVVEGTIWINIDDVNDHYEAAVYIIPSTTDIPRSMIRFSTQNKKTSAEVETFVFPVDPDTLFVEEWDNIKHKYAENVYHSKTVKMKLCLLNEKLIVDAKTDLGFEHTAELTKSSNNTESIIQSEILSWEGFKQRISTSFKSGYIFRGQQHPWKLCTSFHRKERYYIGNFMKNDVRQLHRKLSAMTSHIFNLNDPDHTGAFLNLLQHHGYPTPLLDWSLSPYVAAFFAFKDFPKGFNSDENVRILIFDSQGWQIRFEQFVNLDIPVLHLSVMEFIAINNPRQTPQQAITTISNISDIEQYIMHKENESKKRFLYAIDIPAKERDLVIEDLRFMGITAGSMFPGIDGICEEMREINF